MMKRIGIIILLVWNVFVTPSSSAQTSVPYQWTEAILTAIKTYFTGYSTGYFTGYSGLQVQ